MKIFPAARRVDANGVRLAVYEEGSGPPIVLLHGFPERAWSWRHQLTALAPAGYRAIAPGLRDYGGSDKRASIADYSINRLEQRRDRLARLEVRMLDDCGHWTQQERPAEVNALLLDWLARRYPAALPPGASRQAKPQW